MSGGAWSVKGWDSLTGSDLWSGNEMLCMAQSPWVQMMAEMWQHLKGRATQPRGSLCEYLGILAAVLAFSPGSGSLWSDLVHAACMCAWKLVKAALVSHVHWLSDLFYLTVTVKFSHSSVSSFEQLYTVIHSGSILFGFCWSLLRVVCNLYPLPGSLLLPLLGSSGVPMPFTLSVQFASFVSFSTLCLLHLWRIFTCLCLLGLTI